MLDERSFEQEHATVFSKIKASTSTFNEGEIGKLKCVTTHVFVLRHEEKNCQKETINKEDTEKKEDKKKDDRKRIETRRGWFYLKKEAFVEYVRCNDVERVLVLEKYSCPHTFPHWYLALYPKSMITNEKKENPMMGIYKEHFCYSTIFPGCRSRNCGGKTTQFFQEVVELKDVEKIKQYKLEALIA